MEVVIEGSRIASTVVLPVLSNFATTTASISQHVGNRLANGAVKTGNDIKNAYLNSGYFANSALHAITFGTWQKWEPGSLQQEYLQSAGQGFGEGVLVADAAASGGFRPGGSPVFATPNGNVPTTQPVVVPTVKATDIHGQLNAKAKPRSYEKPIGRRIKFSSRKKAYEAAKRNGKGEPVLHGDGEHGPHYHPGDGKGKPLNHDHYYFPENQF